MTLDSAKAKRDNERELRRFLIARMKKQRFWS
jgi:hypothetical protein